MRDKKFIGVWIMVSKKLIDVWENYVDFPYYVRFTLEDYHVNSYSGDFNFYEEFPW